MNPDLKKILDAVPEWYLQGLEGWPLLISIPFVAGSDWMKKMHSVSYQTWLMWIKNNVVELYFDKQNMKTAAGIMCRKINAEPDFFRKNNTRWQKKLAGFWKLAEKISETSLHELSAAELDALYEKYADAFFDAWLEFIFIDMFDPVWEEYISMALTKHGITLSDDEIKTLTTPIELSFVQKERLELLKIVRVSGGAKEFEKHQQKWFWYQDNYGNCRFLDAIYFSKKAQECTQKDVSSEIKKLEELPTRQKRKQQDIIRRKKLPKDVCAVLGLFSELAHYRDKRKEFMLRGDAVVYRLVEEYARRLELPVDLILQLAVSEVSGILNKNREQLKKRLEQRKKKGTIVYQPENKLLKVTEDEEEVEAFRKKMHQKLGIRDDVTEIKGACACRGVVTGVVKVIDKVEEFRKMNKGDILVSKMTRPEFVPVMKKAAAIITDEGGITCHAAIVARELNIPCVIGTQIATNTLKDGDEVEVDADRGIVMVLQRTPPPGTKALYTKST